MNLYLNHDIYIQRKVIIFKTISDYIDIVTDQIGSDYRKDEDPRIYVSANTNRGPLCDDWRSEYTAAQKAHFNDKHIMCAYKMCRVEFRYWGMQTKIERFIHDIGELNMGGFDYRGNSSFLRFCSSISAIT